VQFIGELVGGELTLRAAGLGPPRELAGPGHLYPGRPGLLPFGGGDEPDQLVV